MLNNRAFLSNIFCQQGVVDKFKRDFQLEVGGMSGDFCNMVAFDHLPEREFLKQLKVPPFTSWVYLCGCCKLNGKHLICIEEKERRSKAKRVS